jgi:DNA-binding response OmpR family regulator
MTNNDDVRHQRIDIPAGQPKMVQIVTPPKSPLSPSLPDLGRILLAEASPLIGRLMVDKLQRYCRRVDVVRDGKDAAAAILESLDDGPIDLILIDSLLPAEDGVCAILRLRQLSFAGPILAITGSAAEAERMLEVGAGCDDAVAKPIHWDQLLTRMFRLAAGRRSSTALVPGHRCLTGSEVAV